MRVLMLTDSDEPSGVGEHMLTLAAALAGQADVTLGFPDHENGQVLAGRAQSMGLDAQLFNPAGATALIDGVDPELVHVHAGIGWEGHSLTHAAAQSGRVVVRTEHLPWLITDPEQRRIYADALVHVHGLIAVSQSAQRGWQAALAGLGVSSRPRVLAVPNGIIAHRRPLVAAGNSVPTILCVGRFTRQKMHHTLIVAVARLVQNGIPARLELVGTGPRMAAMKRLVQRLQLDDNVAFLGRRNDVPDRMAAADILALPSSFEGLPLVVLEAMAAGLPVVASRIGGVVDALGPDHPWLVRPGDSRALADALREALADPARTARVADTQQQRFRDAFTADRMAADTLNIYRAAERRRNGGRMDKVRLGFIGAGGIAHRHFGVLETMDDVSVTAIADPDATRAADAASRVGATAYADHEAMLANETLDAVYICVPPFAHGAPERACISQNLPFFVEKPLSLDLALAEAIADEVRAADLITAAGYHWRYLDTMDEARSQLAQNPAHLMQGFWLDQTPPPEWWWHEDQSGGQVVEQATHLIDAARFLAGDVTEVFGLAAQRERGDFPGLTVPTATAATLRFASGAVANLSSTCLLRWNHRVRLDVFSDAMAIEITDHDLMVDVGRGRPVRRADGDPVWREDRDFVEAVMGRDNRIRCPYPEALETHRVALAITQSAQTGAVVRLEGLRANPQPMFCQTPA